MTVLRRAAGIFGLAAALLAAACGGSNTTPAPIPEPPPQPPPAVRNLPENPDAIALELWVHVGFPLGIAYRLRQPPLYVVSAGGTLYYDASEDQYREPLPLLPPILSVDLGASDFTRIVDGIGLAGLPEHPAEPDPEDNPIRAPNSRLADANVTEVIFRDRELALHRIRVLGLLVDEHTDPRVIRLGDFVTTLKDVAERADLAPYAGDRVQVYMAVAGTSFEPEATDHRPWPIPDFPTASDPGIFDTCAVYEGAAGEALLATFETATEHTRWVRDEVVYHLVPRVLVPGEQGCPL